MGEREDLQMTVNPEMDGFIYVATWDADNHGAMYPEKMVRFKTFKRFLLEKLVERAKAQE